MTTTRERLLRDEDGDEAGEEATAAADVAAAVEEATDAAAVDADDATPRRLQPSSVGPPSLHSSVHHSADRSR